MQNAQPTTNCAKWILKVDYVSISKQQKKFGVSEMQGSGAGNPTNMLGLFRNANIRRCWLSCTIDLSL